MRSYRRISLIVVLTTLITAGLLAGPAKAAPLKTTTGRACLIANDILCVNLQTTYEFTECDFSRCFVRIVDRISGSARLLPGILDARWTLVAPQNQTLTGTCAWPGITTVGCTVTRTFQLSLLYIGGPECKDFDLTSQGTASIIVAGTIGKVPLPVTAIKRDRFRICVTNGFDISIDPLPTPEPPPIPI